MTLQFPNPSRSYDPDRHRIRFWGHDNTLEVPFFLEEDALLKLAPNARGSEASLLAAFDAARSRIMEVATALYSAARGSRRDAVSLTATDF